MVEIAKNVLGTAHKNGHYFVNNDRKVLVLGEALIINTLNDL
jgi:hypothetical protein